MALTANRDVDHYIDQELRSFRVAASAHIYQGAFVGLAPDGYAQALAPGGLFVGIAYEEMDNAGGSDAAVSVRVYTLGDFGLSLSGAVMSDIGRAVFASSDDTVTFAGACNTCVGRVQDLIRPGKIILRIEPRCRPTCPACPTCGR